MSAAINRTPYPPGPPTPLQPPQQPKNAPHRPHSGGYFNLPFSTSHSGTATPSTPPPHYKSNSYFSAKPGSDTGTPLFSPNPESVIDFTYTSDLGAENVPSSVTGETVAFNQNAEQQHHDFAFTYHAGARGIDKSSTASQTGTVVALALEGSDQESINIIRWAAKEIMTPTGTLVIIRAVKRPEGFRGNFGRAADLMATVEVRAKQEAEQLINAAARALSRVGKDQVEIVVKYRVGEHRERIRQILEEVHPTKLIIGSNKRRIGTRFHHGSPNAMIPADLNVELITAPEGGISTPGSVGTAGTP